MQPSPSAIVIWKTTIDSAVSHIARQRLDIYESSSGEQFRRIEFTRAFAVRAAFNFVHSRTRLIGFQERCLLYPKAASQAVASSPCRHAPQAISRIDIVRPDPVPQSTAPTTPFLAASGHQNLLGLIRIIPIVL